MSPSSQFEERLSSAMRDSVVLGAVALVACRGDIRLFSAAGKRSSDNDSPLHKETVFDVGGLTGPVVTNTLILKLISEGKIGLHERVSRYLQSFGVLGKSAATIEHLLVHTSSLPDTYPFYRELHDGARTLKTSVTSKGAKDHILNAINRLAVKTPPGERRVRSDVGLIVLGEIIELLTGLPLDQAAHKFLFQPLGMRNSGYVNTGLVKRRGLETVSERIASSGSCPWRQREICGEVFEPNAWLMGGVAGHSGLFSNAVDLGLFGQELLRALSGKSEFLPQELAALCVNSESSHRCGWEVAATTEGLEEASLGAKSFGYCDPSGACLWLDPDTSTVFVLLLNRSHREEVGRRLISVRTELLSLLAAIVK